MPEFKMLDEVIHYCTRCKLDLNHRMTRVTDGVPKRVLCLTCHTERMYRPKAPAVRKAAAGRAAAARATIEAEWRAKLHADNGPGGGATFSVDFPFAPVTAPVTA